MPKTIGGTPTAIAIMSPWLNCIVVVVLLPPSAGIGRLEEVSVQSSGRGTGSERGAG